MKSFRRKGRQRRAPAPGATANATSTKRNARTANCQYPADSPTKTFIETNMIRASYRLEVRKPLFLGSAGAAADARGRPLTVRWSRPTNVPARSSAIGQSRTERREKSWIAAGSTTLAGTPEWSSRTACALPTSGMSITGSGAQPSFQQAQSNALPGASDALQQ
jgi:hypothetical protein